MKAIRHKPSGEIFLQVWPNETTDEFEIIEVLILENKPVTEEVILDWWRKCPFDISLKEFDTIFHTALDYLGVKVEEESK